MPLLPHQEGVFPIQNAFVVQFAADTALVMEHLSGRVEHIASGQSTTFQSWDGLQQFCAQVLQNLAATRDRERGF